ncbi:hypothetical protein O9992_27210 [Vibrio lentus]|nr:hypothetical protein [Vibrio lentus]
MAIWYVAVATDITWPWYCVIGVLVNAIVAYAASLLLTANKQKCTSTQSKVNKQSTRV